MTGLHLSKTVPEFLASHPEQKFKARDIAKYIFTAFPEACQAKKSATTYIKTDKDLINQIVAEIGSQRPAMLAKNPKMRTMEGKPRLFYWTNLTDEEEVAAAEASIPGSKGTTGAPSLKEAELYPKLSEYLWSSSQIHSMRIDEKVSSNKLGPNGNRWLFPDVVGMENLTTDWHPDISAVVEQFADRKCRLWSFEVKVLLNRSNLRETFFQAVSNSSWSNFGYLVAAQISEDAHSLRREMRMLSALHGIGIIELDAESPADSTVLFQARERENIDWASCNRLARENKDFQHFIQAVRKFHQTGDPHQKEWYVPALDKGE